MTDYKKLFIDLWNASSPESANDMERFAKADEDVIQQDNECLDSILKNADDEFYKNFVMKAGLEMRMDILGDPSPARMLKQAIMKGMGGGMAKPELIQVGSLEEMHSIVENLEAGRHPLDNGGDSTAEKILRQAPTDGNTH